MERLTVRQLINDRVRGGGRVRWRAKERGSEGGGDRKGVREREKGEGDRKRGAEGGRGRERQTERER